MSHSLLSEEICSDLCVYMVFMNMNFLNMILLNMNMFFFFMFSFIELPLCALRHFSMILLRNAHLEEDVLIRREALKKLNCLFPFLDFKAGVYFKFRFHLQETDKLNFTPSLSPSHEDEERPAVYTGQVLCQICFTGCLKKNVKREKLEKISNIEHFR